MKFVIVIVIFLLNLSWETWKYIYIIFHLSKLGWCKVFKPLLMEDKGSLTLHSQN